MYRYKRRKQKELLGQIRRLNLFGEYDVDMLLDRLFQLDSHSKERENSESCVPVDIQIHAIAKRTARMQMIKMKRAFMFECENYECLAD